MRNHQEHKRVFGLVIDFGTSQSPKSTRPLTTYLCPSRPGHQALRNNFASSLLLRTWLPMTGRRVRRPTLFSLWRKARRENSAASRLLGTTSLRFALHGWQRLQVYLSDPDVPIDTNHLERALRVIPMGRKNWLFCWTEVGAQQVGIIQSLLTTCRLQGINPYTYLVDVLMRIDLHPASEVLDLTPRVWKDKFADNPLKSDLAMVRQ